MHLIYLEHLKNIAARAAFVVIMLKTKQLMAAMFVQNHAASVPLKRAGPWLNTKGYGKNFQ